jgi:S1-C subfamily serine protease
VTDQSGQQSGQDGARPYGDDLYRPEAQPWDPAYYPNAPYQSAGYPYTSYPYPAPYGVAPVPPTAPKRRRRGVAAVAIGALAAAAIFGAGVATGNSTSVSGTGAIAASGSSGSSGSGSSGGSSNGGSTTDPYNGYPFGGTGSGSGPGSGSSGSTGTQSSASTKQQVGVVDIDTQLTYQSAAAAGTGLVLTSDGEILTNNHVINGATSIKVTIVSSGKTYTAKVVGTVPTRDIALLKLVNASGLKTANLGDSSGVAVGDSVTGVGNAGGSGGTPSAAAGKVTALNKTITASDEDGSSSETLRGVIVTDAPIQAGDSGGPLYSSDDTVIGIDTAASTSGASTGFAIPINTALSIVDEIKKGVETSSVHIGYPGFLGISMAPSTTSPLIYQVVAGGPAAKSGLASGDVITKVNSTAVKNQTQLKKTVSTLSPGSKVSVTYLDQSNASHTVTVTLIAGPAD